MIRRVAEAARAVQWLMVPALLFMVVAPASAQEGVADVLDARRAELAQDEAQIARFREESSERRKAFFQQIASLKQRHDVLAARKRLIGNNPHEIRDLALLVTKLQQELKRRTGVVRATAEKLQAIEQRATQLQKDIQVSSRDTPDAETRNKLAALSAIGARVARDAAAQRSLLTSSISEADRLKDHLEAMRTELDNSLPSAWSSHFLEPERGYLSVVELRGLYGKTAARARDVRTTFIVDTGLNRENLAPLIGKLVFASALLLAVAWIVLRKVRAKWPERVPARLRGPLAWIAVGLGIIVALRFSPSIHLTAMLTAGRVLLLFGLMQAFWRLRRVGNEPPASRSPLRLLWLAYLVAAIVNLAAVPGALVSLASPIFLLAWSLWMKRQSDRIPTSLEGRMLLVSVWGYRFLAVPSILGWGNLVVLVVSMWFIACLLVQGALVVQRLLADWGRQSSERGITAVLAGVALGLGYPAIWFGAVSFWIQWLAPRIGRPHLYLEVLSYDVGLEKVSFSVLRVVGIVVVFFACRAALSVAKSVIQRVYRGEGDTGPGAADSIATVVVYAGWCAFAVLALSVLGVSFTSLAVIAGGLSVGIGFGMQNIVNNFVGGMILLIGRSVQRGDVIDIAGVTGVVQEVTIRNTVVQSYDNSTLFVPNSQLITERLTNWTHRDRSVRRELIVGVAYGTDTELVHRLLLEAASRTYGVLWEPTPTVLFWDFGASSLEFRMRVWVKDYDVGLTVLSDLRKEVDRLFREHGVEIAFPQQDIHVRSTPGLTWMDRLKGSRDTEAAARPIRQT